MALGSGHSPQTHPNGRVAFESCFEKLPFNPFFEASFQVRDLRRELPGVITIQGEIMSTKPKSDQELEFYNDPAIY